jgi:peptidyl-prolyl cis-trans isomerase C
MSYPFHRLGPSVAMLVCATLVPGLAVAQSGTKPGVSPVSPPTLKAPVFDTTTPAYNVPNVQGSDKTVVAEVEGHAITLGQLADAIKELPSGMKAMPYDVLFGVVQNQLIAKQAAVILARRQGLDADPVVSRRMTAASDDVLANAYIERQASKDITEQDLLDRYARDIAGKPGPEEAHVRVITVPKEADARDVIKKLQSGADFAQLAQQVSTDATAGKGGDLGFVTRASVNPELSGAIFAVPAGQVVQSPVASNGTWFVLKVEERRIQPTPPFSTVRDQLEQAIIKERSSGVVKNVVNSIATVRIFDIRGKELQDLPPNN